MTEIVPESISVIIWGDAHTSIEFPILNFVRVLHCLGTEYEHFEMGPEVEHLANRQIWSMQARWVRRDISVGVEYLPGNKNEPPTLVVSAQGRGTS